MPILWNWVYARSPEMEVVAIDNIKHSWWLSGWKYNDSSKTKLDWTKCCKVHKTTDYAICRRKQTLIVMACYKGLLKNLLFIENNTRIAEIWHLFWVLTRISHEWTKRTSETSCSKQEINFIFPSTHVCIVMFII